MKSAKRILALALIAMMALSLAACSKTDAEKLIGKWDIDTKSLYIMAGVPEDQVEEFKSMVGDMSGSMEFTKDGKIIMIMTAMGQTNKEENTYTVEGNKIVINGDPAEFKISGKTLTLKHETFDLTLTKAK